MKHILIAPNAFKHSLSAQKAAKEIAEGLQKSNLKCQTKYFPIGDGGDGTCELIHEKLKGKRIMTSVSDPLGKSITVPISLIHNGETAVIEMADASGIRLLKENKRNPLITSSQGTGELIKTALDHKVQNIVLGMGGSATVDGGCGMLHALGVRFLDSKGNPLQPIPKALSAMESIDTSGLDTRLKDCNITIMCDVQNKLLGEKGAAPIFGPQKGASKEAVSYLDYFLEHFNKITLKQTQKDMSTITSGGAAGGAAAGMYAFTNANLVNGINYFLKLTNFEEKLKNIDYIITGEGKIDDQTLSGKGPFGIAKIAKKHQIPCIGLAGEIPLNPSLELSELFEALIPINHKAMTLEKAIKNTADNLKRTAEMLGNLLKV